MAKPKRRARLRHMFHRSNDRVRRALRLIQWRDDQQVALDTTATGLVFTTPGASDVFTSVAHGLTSGEGPYQATTDTTLPAGMSASNRYYPEVLTVDTFRLRDGKTRNGVIVTPGDAGTGIHTLTKIETNAGIFANLRYNQPVEIENAADIDDLR